jgi:threonine/homoserine/homoserine lactone efflux protein
MHVVALGFGLGFVVAAAIGPISLLCIRTVLRGALGTGIAIGAGAAVIDATYALLGAIGAGRLLEVDALRLTLGLVGTAETLALCLGVGCGTLTWFTALSLGLTAIRGRVGDRLLKAVDIGSGLGLLLFSGALGVRAARDA